MEDQLGPFPLSCWSSTTSFLRSRSTDKSLYRLLGPYVLRSKRSTLWPRRPALFAYQVYESSDVFKPTMGSANKNGLLDCESPDGPGPCGDNCPICLNKISSPNISTTHMLCRNSFHRWCLSEWVSYCVDRAADTTCLLCRRINAITDYPEHHYQRDRRNSA